MGGSVQPPISGPGLGRGSRLMELTGSWFTHAAQVVRVSSCSASDGFGAKARAEAQRFLP
jgi:hypothetical protein